MVIAKPEWFGRRKYTGWGVTPKTWQGWVYIVLVIGPIILFQSLPFWTPKIRIVVTILWLAFLLIDILDVMLRMKLDEREKIHEAISERNALWAIMTVLVVAIVYDVVSGALSQELKIDWFLVVALFAGVIVKAISNVVLDRRN